LAEFSPPAELAAAATALIVAMAALCLRRREDDAPLAAWTRGWLFLGARYILAMPAANLLPGPLLALSQLVALVGGMYLARGSNLLVGASSRRKFIAATVAALVNGTWLALAAARGLPPFWLCLPVAASLAVTYALAARALLARANASSCARAGAGTLVLLALHALAYPLVIGAPEPASWHAAIAAILHAALGVCLALLYHERRAQRSAEQEQQLAMIAEHAADLIWRYRLTEPRGWEYLSPSAEALTGYSLEEFARDPELYLRLILPEDRARLDELVFSSAQGGAELIRCQRKGGGALWLEVRAAVLRDGRGRPVAIEGIARDITARVEMERKLRESEARYRAVVEDQTELIHRMRPDGTITFVNDAFCRYFGRAQEELLGKSFFSLLPAEDRELAREYFRSLDRYNPVGRSQHLFSLQGEERWVQWTDRALFNDEGELTEYQSVGRDVTQEKLAVRALQESEEKYRSLFHAAQDAILLFELGPGEEPGLVLEANELACERYGYARDELLGRNMGELIHPQGQESSAAGLRNLVRRRNAIWQTVHRRADGSPLPVEVSAGLIMPSGRSAVLAVVRDLSERQRLQEQLLQSQRLETVGRLAGGVAHDFNNLLTAIIGHATFALEGLPPGSPVREEIEGIMRAAESAAELTRQLLAFSRRQFLQKRVLNLNDLILGMQRLLLRLLNEKISLVIVPAANLWPVEADPAQLQQVLANLVANARDAMPEGGRIVIETANVVIDEEKAAERPGQAPGDFVMFSVSDTGVGMSPEVLEHIFEPFFTTKGLGKGTGLGLSSAFGIVKQHGGNICVYSEPGHGSTFKVYLPRYFGNDLGYDPPESKKPLPRGSEVILLVEDESSVRELSARALRSLGYTVHEAANGVEAIALVKQLSLQPHLLVSDVMMPGIDGPSLAQALRAQQPELLVLFISGYSQMALQGLPSGDGYGFLQKPYSAAALAEAVRAVLDAAKGTAAIAGQALSSPKRA
jgi:PAS domain S-box-containing protein